MKICPKCKDTSCTDTDNFCYRDGTPLEPLPVHPCGNALTPHDKFCPRCGEAIEQPKTEEAPKKEYNFGIGTDH